MRILIVEDDIRLARALERILQENGYLVDTVHDGASGRDWAIVGPYDAIVCDVMLPGMDGFEAVRAIRHAGVTTPSSCSRRKAPSPTESPGSTTERTTI